MRFLYCTILCLVTLINTNILRAQAPVNDNCTTATEIRLTNSNYCSKDGEYTNVGATVSGLGTNRCLSANGLDVWFSFVAIATDVKVTVLGRTSTQPSGTMARPEIGLYTTSDCANFNDLVNCDASTTGLASVESGGLIPGERYYIRIQGGNSTTGTFKLCVQNYNPPVDPSGDCSKASVLCDKSPFSISGIQGGGSDPTELNNVPCRWTDGCSPLSRNQNAENNSLWFKWTCATSGTLTFKLTPTKSDLDIDFVVFELPNGINDCSGKQVLRCMFSGADGTSTTSPCAGATGLRDGEGDVSEPTGCSCVPHNNFLSALDMVAGKSYALAIDIPYAAREGFSIEWGGTGTFVGPEAKIKLDHPDKKYCLGENVTFTDASTFALGQITKREWKFGKGASIDSTTGTGPFRVFYKTPGWKSVVLTVTTNRGCVVTSILDSIYIKPFEFDSVVRRPTCQLGTDGMIRVKVVSCGRAPILYNWENTGFTTRDSITGLTPGRYRVAITDSSRAYFDTLVFNLKQFEVELDTARRIVTPPTCFGLSNGRIELNPATGVAPFRYRWNNGAGYTADNTLAALGEGQYTVEIRDNNNCRGDYAFDVIAPPKVQVSIDTFNISCNGLSDGMAVAYPSGGVGNYSVSWSRGDVGDTIRNLKAGSYQVFVRDSNQCEIVSGVLITEPTKIGLNTIRIQPAKCYGDSTAELVISGFGGTPPYRFSIDGIRFQRDSAFLKIPARKYNVVIRDSTGCRTTIDVDVPQPPQLQVSAGPDIDIELGFSGELRATVVPSTKLVSYTWTPKDSTMTCPTCPQTTIFPLNNTVYTVTVRDSSGCTAFDQLLVQVIKKRPIYIPNVFSPIDHNGVNDYFTVYGNQSAVVIKELKVFNRWGGIVFQGTNLPLNRDDLGWDGTSNGTRLEPDVFAFYAIVKFIDGEEIMYKGDITIVR